MYLIEFEECERDGQKQTVVRILDLAVENPEGRLLGETVYLGSPPGLCFQIGVDFTALRVPQAIYSSQ